MGISRGMIGMDDYIWFGKMCDELSKYASIITYVPKTDMLIIVVRDEFVEIVSHIIEEAGLKVSSITKGMGIMKFIKVVMRG